MSMINYPNLYKLLGHNKEAIEQLEQEIQGIYQNPFHVVTKNYSNNNNTERKVYGAGTTKLLSQNFYFNISQFGGRVANDLMFVKLDLKDQAFDGRKYFVWNWQVIDNGSKIQVCLTLTNYNDNTILQQILDKIRLSFYFTKEASALLENIEE